MSEMIKKLFKAAVICIVGGIVGGLALLAGLTFLSRTLPPLPL